MSFDFDHQYFVLDSMGSNYIVSMAFGDHIEHWASVRSSVKLSKSGIGRLMKVVYPLHIHSHYEPPFLGQFTSLMVEGKSNVAMKQRVQAALESRSLFPHDVIIDDDADTGKTIDEDSAPAPGHNPKGMRDSNGRDRDDDDEEGGQDGEDEYDDQEVEGGETEEESSDVVSKQPTATSMPMG